MSHILLILGLGVLLGNVLVTVIGHDTEVKGTDRKGRVPSLGITVLVAKINQRDLGVYL